METVAAASLPVLLTLIALFGYFRGLPVFESFLRGARKGIGSSLKILPSLIALVMAVKMLRVSGLPELLAQCAAPLTERLGLSPQLLPLFLLRPVSGSGSSAYAMDLMQTFGPDSETGQIASVLAASTETTFYAVAVYFGGRGYRSPGHALPAALLGDATAVLLSILTVKLFA